MSSSTITLKLCDRLNSAIKSILPANRIAPSNYKTVIDPKSGFYQINDSALLMRGGILIALNSAKSSTALKQVGYTRGNGDAIAHAGGITELLDVVRLTRPHFPEGHPQI